MIITKSKGLQGEIFVPSDKSISHRALILGSIAEGTSHIKSFLYSEDTLSLMNCLKRLGIEIVYDNKILIIKGRGLYGLTAPRDTLNAGNSGTAARLLSGLLAGQHFDSYLDGDASLKKRPMDRIMQPLEQMGGKLEYTGTENFPVKINGNNLKGITYKMPVASAQVKSAIMLAALYAQGETTVIEPIKSRDHTEKMMLSFGVNLKLRQGVGVDETYITVNQTRLLEPCDVDIPGDISSAAFFIVAALIVPNSEIVLKNVGLNQTRIGILTALKLMGGNITVENIKNEMEPRGNIIVKHSQLKGIEIGGAIIPSLIDEIPILSIAAAFAEGKTIIKDSQELRVKETNRIENMVKELKKAGVYAKTTEDGMIINGSESFKTNKKKIKFSSYGDHRMAMGLSVMAMALDAECEIQGWESVNISFPSFYDLMLSVAKC